MNHRFRVRIALLGAVLALAAGGFAPPAAIAKVNAAIADCNAHGKLTRTYSLSELQIAITTMPSDVKEYTNCYDVINRALLAQTSGTQPGSGGTGGDSGGSFLPTPVIVVLVVLLLAAATFGAMAIRRRRGEDGDDAGEDGDDAGEDGDDAGEDGDDAGEGGVGDGPGAGAGDGPGAGAGDGPGAGAGDARRDDH